MYYCKKCGISTEKYKEFCTNCGAKKSLKRVKKEKDKLDYIIYVLSTIAITGILFISVMFFLKSQKNLLGKKDNSAYDNNNPEKTVINPDKPPKSVNKTSDSLTPKEPAEEPSKVKLTKTENKISADKKINEYEAEALLKEFLIAGKYISPSDKDCIIEYEDEIRIEQGRKYYVIHVYYINYEAGHTATLGWFGVETNAASVYDFISNEKLIEYNKEIKEKDKAAQKNSKNKTDVKLTEKEALVILVKETSMDSSDFFYHEPDEYRKKSIQETYHDFGLWAEKEEEIMADFYYRIDKNTGIIYVRTSAMEDEFSMIPYNEWKEMYE